MSFSKELLFTCNCHLYHKLTTLQLTAAKKNIFLDPFTTSGHL